MIFIADIGAEWFGDDEYEIDGKRVASCCRSVCDE